MKTMTRHSPFKVLQKLFMSASTAGRASRGLVALAVAFLLGGAARADQRVNVYGYRLDGGSAIYTANVADVVDPTARLVAQGLGRDFVATPPTGRKTTGWWWAVTNMVTSSTDWRASSAAANIALSDDKATLTWTYASEDMAYLLVAFEYIRYGLAYDLAGGTAGGS